MDIKQIKNLAKLGESGTLEFKKTTSQLKPAFETLCAFLNGKGGIVLIGVADKGQVVGQDVSDGTRQEIARELGKIEPPAQIAIYYVPVNGGKQVIIMQATDGTHAPYSYDGRAYQRDQSVTKRMPQARYDQLVSRRNQVNFSWESFEAQKRTLADLDQNLILEAAQRAVGMKRMPGEALRQDIPKLLESLQLMIAGQLNNAAIVLFGTRFQPEYPQCQLKMARFKGTDRHEFLDSDLIYGNVFELLEKGMLFVRRHLPVAAKIEPGKVERVETPLIPFDAIREALINSLCHRDYSVYGGSIGLAIYDDHMEIFNNGGLLPGVTLEKIKSGFSQLRNTVIANVFYRCNLIEKWGRGIPVITHSCVASGDPEPEFISDEIEFKVVFKFPTTMKPSVIILEREYENLGLSKRQREIIEILASAKELGMKEIIEKLKEPPAERTLRDDFAILRKLRVIGSRGHARTTVWFLVKRG